MAQFGRRQPFPSLVRRFNIYLQIPSPPPVPPPIVVVVPEPVVPPVSPPEVPPRRVIVTPVVVDRPLYPLAGPGLGMDRLPHDRRAPVRLGQAQAVTCRAQLRTGRAYATGAVVRPVTRSVLAVLPPSILEIAGRGSAEGQIIRTHIEQVRAHGAAQASLVRRRLRHVTQGDEEDLLLLLLNS